MWRSRRPDCSTEASKGWICWSLQMVCTKWTTRIQKLIHLVRSRMQRPMSVCSGGKMIIALAFYTPPETLAPTDCRSTACLWCLSNSIDWTTACSFSALTCKANRCRDGQIFISRTMSVRHYEILPKNISNCYSERTLFQCTYRAMKHQDSKEFPEQLLDYTQRLEEMEFAA